MIENTKVNDPAVMYLIVRTGLGMSLGKTAVQCGHGVQLVMQCTLGERKFANGELELFTEWLQTDYTKIALGASDEDWNSIKEEIASSDTHTATVVVDKGYTELKPDTETVLAIWPMRKSEAPESIKKLKRLK